MSRCFVYVLPFALVALLPAVSSAASENCPDGWFCEPNAPPAAGPSERPAPTQPPPASPGAPSQPGGAPAYPTPGYAAPGYAEPGYAEPGYPAQPGDLNAELSAEPPPPPDKRQAKRRRPRGFREWGLNLHLEGALLGHESERASNTGMGGLGVAFRYRLMPRLAFEAGVDLLTSDDRGDYRRREAALLLNALLYFNPRDVVQVYALGGFAFTGANVRTTPRAAEMFRQREQHYSYFGGQLGLGVEVRVTRRFAVAGDVIGFLRGRTEPYWDDRSHYVDDYRDRITSGGGLLRAGVTFYW